jgi:hypothetical protein
MVKKLKTLLVLLLLSSTSFSQKDTNKICFSYNKAKLIAIDLVKGDSAITELKVVNKLVYQLNEKIDSQDSLIILYVEKEKNYNSQIDNYKNIVVEKDKVITNLEKDVTH